MINSLLDLIITNNAKLGLTEDVLIARVEQLCKLCIPRTITQKMIINRIKILDNYKSRLVDLLQLKLTEQRSPAWYLERYNMITASDMATALAKGKFESQKDFIMKKCMPLTTKSTFNMTNEILTWGIKYESVAANIYSHRNKVNLFDFGLIKHPKHNFFGASPDSISENGIMIEIKCPYRRVIDGSIPEQYYYQIQGQLDVCDLEECDYVECAFREYSTLQDYFEDSDENDVYTNNMKEKGIFYEFITDTSNVEYIYSPFLCEKSVLNVWIAETELLLSDKQYKVKYWHLHEYHCKRIYRNREFFDTNIRYIKKIWDKICDYRSNQELYNKEIVSVKRKKFVVEYIEEKYDKIVPLSKFSIIKNDED